jgi:hypothetical protein
MLYYVISYNMGMFLFCFCLAPQYGTIMFPVANSKAQLFPAVWAGRMGQCLVYIYLMSKGLCYKTFYGIKS